jgi:hypothetical protein
MRRPRALTTAPLRSRRCECGVNSQEDAQRMF